MTVTATPAAPATAGVRIHCPAAEDAGRLRRALAVDDPGSMELRVEGHDLVLAVSSSSALGLLRTLDDALACLRAAEPDL